MYKNTVHSPSGSGAGPFVAALVRLLARNERDTLPRSVEDIVRRRSIVASPAAVFFCK